jgi:hypothetical protein
MPTVVVAGYAGYWIYYNGTQSANWVQRHRVYDGVPGIKRICSRAAPGFVDMMIDVLGCWQNSQHTQFIYLLSSLFYD